MESVSPVWTEEDIEGEKVIALDQPQYKPLVVMPFKFGDGTPGMSVRFRLSDADKFAIQTGADLVITELTFGEFSPIDVRLCQPNKRPYE